VERVPLPLHLFALGGKKRKEKEGDLFSTSTKGREAVKGLSLFSLRITWGLRKRGKGKREKSFSFASPTLSRGKEGVVAGSFSTSFLQGEERRKKGGENVRFVFSEMSDGETWRKTQRRFLFIFPPE